MINRTPTGWTENIEENYGREIFTTSDIYDNTCFRVSALLGPNGEPLQVSVPRQRIGFYVEVK